MRSLLFAPADRLELVAKLPRSGPDAVCLDLEDGVAPARKEVARATLSEAVASVHGRGPIVTVRVDAVGSPGFAADVAALAAVRADPALAGAVAMVVVPKLESAGDVAAVTAALPGLAVLAGIESTRGVLDVRDVLGGPVTVAYFGAEDYVADLGGVRTDAGTEVLYARSRVALACRVHGVTALDQVVTAVHDDDRFRADAAQGRALGFGGKLCVHPGQVALAHAAFAPSEDEVAHARRVLAAGEGQGAVLLDGRMVDEPMLRLARDVLARAEPDAR